MEIPKALLRLLLDELERDAADAIADSERRREDSVVGKWSASDVVAWVWSLEFGSKWSIRVARCFAEAGIDGQDLLSLTEADLFPYEFGGIGIDLAMHRRKILRALDAVCQDDAEAVRALDHALVAAVERHMDPEERQGLTAAIEDHRAYAKQRGGNVQGGMAIASVGAPNDPPEKES